MRKTKRIAFVSDYMESEYSQKLFEGAASYAQDVGMEIVGFSISQIFAKAYAYDYQALSLASHLTPSNFDGVIFVSGSQLCYTTIDYLSSYIKSFSPLPVVSIGNQIPGTPSVVSSSKDGFSQTVSHLIEKHGCRRIALMSVQSNSTDIKERTQVFKDVLLSHGIEYDESMVIYGGYSYEMSYKALSAYVDVKGQVDFDAMVALNDQMAYGCLDYFRKHDIRVPEDVLVTGFDDEERSLLMTPSLTSLNQELELQGKKSMEMLALMMDGKKVDDLVMVPATPVLRQSCGCVPKNAAPFQTMNIEGKIISKEDRQILSSASDWCMKKSQFTQVIQLYTQMQTDMTLNQFRYHVNSDLMSMGILSGAVVLFEQPISTDQFEYFQLPQKAMVYSALDKFSGFWLGDKEKPIHFNPRENMIPEGIFETVDRMQVCALFHAATLYGYLIFLPGNYDMSIYSMVSKMFANALDAAYRLSRAEEEKEQLKQEYNMASQISVTDELTGLLNRRGFMDLGQKTLSLSKASGQFGMVIFGDIDGLKKINDTYGHAAGDVAIQAEASILKNTFRKTDIIGRLGGDEFAIIAPGLSEKNLIMLRKKLTDMCGDWSRDTDQKYAISISLGAIAYNSDDKEDLQSLLGKADELLYKEKQFKYSTVAPVKLV